MLPRPHRLPASEIPHVMKYGGRVAGNGMILIYRNRGQGTINNKQETSRFAFIVSTKVDKRATVRNRMRRLMSESVRHVYDSIRPGVDGVFAGSKSLIGLTQQEAETIVQNLLRKADLLKT